MNPLSKILAALLALALAWGVWGEIRVANARADEAKAVAALKSYKAEISEAARKAEAKARAEEARIAREHLEALNHAHAQALAVAADRDRARDASRRLRDELAALRASLGAKNPAPAPGGDATDPPASVLADLLGRCSERREELARYADDARLAGETCQRAYRALNPITTSEPRP